MSQDPLRILLIYPPSNTQSHSSYPMGIVMLAAVLENAGHEVHIVDANAERNRRDTEEIVRLAGKLKPDVIGMTLLTPMIRESYKLASRLRGNGATLIAGGPHATIMPEEAISHGFDAVVIGEGEPTIAEAVQALHGLVPNDSVRGWVYKDSKGLPRCTEQRPPVNCLDDLPLPARHLVNPLDYGPIQNPALHADLFSSRGCPARCTFCAGQLFGKHFRARSAGNILDEIRHINSTYGTKHFHFVDDAMTMDKERVKQICEGLQQSNLKITWSMMTRIDLVNDENLLVLLNRAGCNRIDFGVESGYPETLRRIRKPHTVEMVRHVVTATARSGIEPYVFFILGFPWEDVAAIEATLNLMAELSPYVKRFHPAIASILIPFPGTEIYETYKEQYELENWWLGTDHNYDAPNTKRHSYFESKIFSRGTVLDADFFHYPTDVKKKIHEVFRFMHRHNLSQAGVISRLGEQMILGLSEKLYAFSPSIERMVFVPITWLEQLCKHIRKSYRVARSYSPA